MDEETKSKKKKIALLVVVAILVVGLFVGLIIFLVNKNMENIKYEPVIDKYSGDEIWNIDEDPELEPGLNMIGFYQILEYGLMNVQYQEVINTIENYITSNYPKVKMISFWAETFEGDATEGVYRFKFVADDGKVFRVNLDTMLTLDDITVEIVAE
jgi:hypothetical protein